MKIMKLKKVITALIMLMFQACAFAVVLPSTPYSGGYSDAGTGMLYSDTGVMFSSSFTQLADGECSSLGEPSRCENCCQGKLAREYCESHPQECAEQYYACFKTCIGEEHEQLAPLESRMAELMLCFMAIAAMVIRVAYNKVITNKN